jgi:hypothetical protein
VEKQVFYKCYPGSNFSGTVSGFNVNAANAVAAFYAAAGQDLAQVISSASSTETKFPQEPIYRRFCGTKRRKNLRGQRGCQGSFPKTQVLGKPIFLRDTLSADRKGFLPLQ